MLFADQPCAKCGVLFTQKSENQYFCSEECRREDTRRNKGGTLTCSNPACGIAIKWLKNRRGRKTCPSRYCSTFCRCFHRDIGKGINRYAFRDERSSEIKRGQEEENYQRMGLVPHKKRLKLPLNEFQRQRKARLKIAYYERGSPHRVVNPFLRDAAFTERRRDAQMQKALKKLNKIPYGQALNSMLDQEDVDRIASEARRAKPLQP